MKRLRNKVFLVIFSLLTIFTFLILVTSTVRMYMEKKNFVFDMLMKVPRSMDDHNEKHPDRMSDDGSKRIFLDSTIYTIVLDDDGNYKELINHTNNDVDEEYIESIADKIIKNHNNNIYIGNLYTNKYAYSFTPNNTLMIMDNSEINNSLVKGLITNIVLFFGSEVVIFIISFYITKWIITPVKKSFEKQKVFVADASHELKTPLSVMIASADAYFNDKDDKWVRNMKNESCRMVKLVTELLDIAKTEEEQDVIMEDSNLSEVILGSILTFESLFYDNDIKLKYDIESDIKMLCNEDLIVELMSILIDNAIKHCNEKGQVWVNLSLVNKQIVLEVKNTGLPIKKEDEEKIFERFYKVDTSRNRNKDNYGLGLAIAKNIVEKHKGKISAHSSNGYTTFKVIWNQK